MWLASLGCIYLQLQKALHLIALPATIPNTTFASFLEILRATFWFSMAHLQKIRHERLKSAERNIVRASYLRQRLAQKPPSEN